MEKKLNKMKSDITARCNRLIGLIALSAILLGTSVSGVIAIDLGQANLGGIFKRSVGLSQCLVRSHSPMTIEFGKKEE